MFAPVLVDAHFFELLRIAHAVPDEIIAAAARPQIVVEPGDRIADDLLALRQEEGEVRKDASKRRRRQVRLFGRAAPNVITGVDGLHFRRNGSAHGRANAVATNQQVSALRSAIGEEDAHFAAVLIKVLEGVA
jgi:hypothetical protein